MVQAMTGNYLLFLVLASIHSLNIYSCMTNFRCPTSMVFVPSKDGISHNPVEYTSPEECATGAQVILGALLRYDALRAKNATM